MLKKKTYKIDVPEVLITQDVVFAIGYESLDMFDLAPDIEKTTGISKQSALDYKETPSDARVYGMCNIMNVKDGACDIFFFINATRLINDIGEYGLQKGGGNIIAHEAFHLTQLMLMRNQLGLNWWKKDWPGIGGSMEDNIDGEVFASVQGSVGAQMAAFASELLLMG